jgi:O-antigen ligase
VTYSGVALKAQTSAGWCVALLGFAIPVSTALDGILTVFVLAAWFIAAPALFRDRRISRAQTRPAPLVLIALALFIALAIACLWSSAPWRDAWSSLSKYLDLLLIPVFAGAAAALAVRKRALAFFIAAIVLNLLVSYGTVFGFWERLPGLHTLPAYPVGFKLSVTHSLLVSLGAYLFLLLARDARRPGVRAACVALAAVCAHNVLFIVVGRTGYLVLAVLLTYFIFNAIPDRRQTLLALLAVIALFASAYFGSYHFAARTQDVASDLTQWKPGAGDETSVGQRIGYYLTTLEMIRDHPLTGVGTGGFAQAYAQKVRGTPARATENPHNDYLMIAAQAGILALGLLVALYAVAWREATRLATRFERDLLRGLVLTLAIAGVFNSALMDHVEGLLFAWGAGLLCAGRREATS